MPTYRSVSHIIEDSIVSYLSSSFNYSGSHLNQLQVSGSNVAFYIGLNNEEITAPAVIVYCHNANEVVYNSRVYEMSTEVICSEMAADISASMLGQLPMYVFNEFVSSSVAAKNFTNNNISVYQVQIQSFDQEVDVDAIHTKGMFRIVGGLV